MEMHGTMAITSAKHYRPKTPYQLVIVEWEDSARPTAEWQWLDNLGAPEAIQCISVGYLVAKTKHALSLAPNLGDIGQANIQASGVIQIPAGAVRKMITL